MFINQGSTLFQHFFRQLERAFKESPRVFVEEGSHLEECACKSDSTKGTQEFDASKLYNTVLPNCRGDSICNLDPIRRFLLRLHQEALKLLAERSCLDTDSSLHHRREMKRYAMLNFFRWCRLWAIRFGHLRTRPPTSFRGCCGKRSRSPRPSAPSLTNV